MLALCLSRGVELEVGDLFFLFFFEFLVRFFFSLSTLLCPSLLVLPPRTGGENSRTSLCLASSLRLHVAALAFAAFLPRASSASAAPRATRAEWAKAAKTAESEA